MAIDATLDAALAANAVRAFVAVKIVLPANTIRLFDGTAVLTIGGETYTGKDATFGTLGVVEAMAESIADEAPTVNVTLLIPSPSAIGTVCAPTAQGSLVTVSFGLVNELSGAAIGTPERIWNGRIDTMKVLAGENAQAVEIQTVSAFDRLFSAEEGARLNSVWHKAIFPGETGLDRCVAGLSDPYWGVAGASKASTGGGSYGDGGGSKRDLLPDNFIFR